MELSPPLPELPPKPHKHWGALRAEGFATPSDPKEEEGEVWEGQAVLREALFRVRWAGEVGIFRALIFAFLTRGSGAPDQKRRDAGQGQVCCVVFVASLICVASYSSVFRLAAQPACVVCRLTSG